LDRIAEIQEFISKGNAGQALNVLRTLVEENNPKFRNDVLLLNSDFNEWSRDQRNGLKPDSADLSRIKIGVLKLCDNLLEDGQVALDSIQDKIRILNASLLKLSSRIELLINIQKEAIQRSYRFSLVLLILGLIVIVFAAISNVISEPKLQIILIIAGLLAILMGGYPLKSIDDKKSSLRVFKLFISDLERIKQESDPIAFEEDIDKIQKLFWETSKKMALNI
jgi:hypothetical protein